jgi:excisionase family DNA binding protein
MTIGEVTCYLKVTEQTVYRLARAKQIPKFKFGDSWRFFNADIDGWVREQSSGAADESRD